MATFHENLVQSFHNFRDKYLKANGNYFKFSYDATTQKYGFTINGTFHPFKLGSTNFVFDTYAEYQAAYSAGDIPVGSVVYIKEGSTDGTITALQVVYNNSTVKGALDKLNNDLAEHVLSFTNILLNQYGAHTLTGLDSSKHVVDKVVIKGSTIKGTYRLIYTDQNDNRVFIQIIDYTTNQPYANTSNVSFDVYYRTIN